MEISIVIRQDLFSKTWRHSLAVFQLDQLLYEFIQKEHLHGDAMNVMLTFVNFVCSNTKQLRFRQICLC